MELFIDLDKALNTAKLVKKPVTVHQDNGKTHRRMQWVDPLTGQPVGIKGKKKLHTDAERWSVDGARGDSRGKEKLYPSVENTSYGNPPPMEHVPILSEKPRVSNVPYQSHEGILRTPAFVSNDYSNFSDLHNSMKVQKKPICNVSPIFAPPKLDNYDHNLSDSELNYRCGDIGPLDTKKLYEGDDLISSFKDGLLFSRDTIKGMGVNVNVVDHVKSVLGGTTKQGLEYAFSIPDGKGGTLNANMDSLLVMSSEKLGAVVVNLGMIYTDDNGEEVGETIRTLHRDTDGVLQVYNDLLDMHSSVQGKGIMRPLYEQTNQLWRHLSKGHPIHENLVANINVGRYSWALNGYDFATSDTLDRARSSFDEYCKSINKDTKEVLNKCGYNDIKELKHSWQFASLDDGDKYHIKGNGLTPMEGHIGKSFMLLGSLKYWGGRLIHNQSDPSETISKMYYKKAKAREGN